MAGALMSEIRPKCELATKREEPLQRASVLAAVYETVVKAGSASIEQIVTELNELPAAGIEAAITELRDLGVLNESRVQSEAIRATSPPLAFSRAVQALLSRLAQDFECVQAIARAVDGCQSNRGTTRTAESQVELVVGVDAIATRLSDLIESAIWSVDSLLPAIPSINMLESVLNADIALAARGIKLRAIYPEAARANAAVMQHLKSVGGIATEVRTSSTTPSRIVIVDNRIAFIRHEDADLFQSASITNDPIIVSSIVGLYDAIWKNSLSVDIQKDQNVLSPIELSILRSMESKSTDKAIARDLNISTRTVYRVIGDLYERTGATTRFRLGVEAERRGWLNDSQ